MKVFITRETPDGFVTEVFEPHVVVLGKIKELGDGTTASRARVIADENGERYQPALVLRMMGCLMDSYDTTPEDGDGDDNMTEDDLPWKEPK